MKPINEIKNFYDEAAYRKLHGFIHTNTRVEYALQSLTAIFSCIQPKRVLEIGCGIGEISYRLAIKHSDAFFKGFDISEQSIHIANSLFKAPNLSYVRADAITEAKIADTEKFDVIFLMDVYEHIPVDFRAQLHSFIKDHVSETAFVFFSCPTPQHLAYLKKNDPEEIQPVDEDISLQELLHFSNDTGLKLTLYKEVSVWRASDYFHAVFSNFFNMQRFSDYTISAKPAGLTQKIADKLKSKIQLLNESNSPAFKKRMIKNALGQSILNKAEFYKK